MAGKRPGGQPALLEVTLVKSTIGHRAAARGTVRALGLRRLHHTVQVPDTPEVRGMLRRVAFLIEVREPSGPAPAAAAADPTEEASA